jgi:hypothetical protein
VQYKTQNAKGIPSNDPSAAEAADMSDIAVETTEMSDISSETDALTRWLFDAALPLWWELGADRVRGGFTRQSASTAPLRRPHRARVIARQAFSYAKPAGSLARPLARGTAPCA